MTDLLRQATSHEVIRANPIPNAPVHPTIPGCEKWTRETLVVALNDMTDVLNARLRAIVKGSYNVPADLTPEQKERYKTLDAEWNARVAYWKAQERAKDVAAHNDEVALREEIIEALVEEGKARHVAANLTNTEAKMLAEGKRLGIL